ncbi:hypothetical protein LSTR_LSTR005374 [Laodelphax striatellus]|uniref:Uncharacterized protein n=1 Tax=Laodelphax striatellus TaxID=195883 RepID=A0A482WS07_LAOST|nr:hypothetical protein LSTR_LSTR005374 [Laodelphax striatellus]
MEGKKQGMVAKSPPSEEKCSATHVSNTSGEDTMTLALTGLGTLQCICGLLMGVFGILAIIHGAAMAGVGAGLWAGAAALACGCVALTAGLKRFCYQNDRTTLALTIYLALCLVCLAVDTLALLLTSTGLLRDSHRPSITYLQLDESGTSQVELEDTNWIPVLANVGLLLSISLHTLATIVAVYRVYKLVCPCTRPRGSSKSGLLFAQESPTASYCSTSGSKHKLVRHWLGQQSPSLTPHPPNILIYPPHLIMEGGSPVYGVIPPPTLYAPYMHPMRPPSSSHYHRRASPNYRGEEERRRRKNYENNKIREKTKPKEKEREITEEELERTYTGLDREIAEEFISIAMQPRDSPIDLNRTSLSKEI